MERVVRKIRETIQALGSLERGAAKSLLSLDGLTRALATTERSEGRASGAEMPALHGLGPNHSAFIRWLGK